jgi:hypothetical protein
LVVKLVTPLVLMVTVRFPPLALDTLTGGTPVPVIPPSVPLPVAVTVAVAVPVAVALALPTPAVVLLPAAREDEYAAQRARPMDCTAPRADAGQEASRQGATSVPIAVCEGPQGQPWSLRLQPAAWMAEAMQAVAQGGSLPRLWAGVRRGRRVVMRASVNFILVVAVVRLIGLMQGVGLCVM